MSGDAGNLRVANELDRISAARVLRDASVVKIDVRLIVEDHVFQHGAEP